MFSFLVQLFRDLVVTPIREKHFAFQESGVRADIGGMCLGFCESQTFPEEEKGFIERTVRCGSAAIEPLFEAIEKRGAKQLFFDTLLKLAKVKGMAKLIADRIDMWSQTQTQIPVEMINLLIALNLDSEDLADILERMLFRHHPERGAEIAPKLGELTEANSMRSYLMRVTCEFSTIPADRYNAAQVLIHAQFTDSSEHGKIERLAKESTDEKVRAAFLVNCPFLSKAAQNALYGDDSSLHVRVAIARSTFDAKESKPTAFVYYIVAAMVGASEEATADATTFIVTTLDFRAIGSLLAIINAGPEKVMEIGIAAALLADIFEKSKEIERERDYYSVMVDEHMTDLVGAFDHVPPQYGPALARLLANSLSPWLLLEAMKSSVGGSVYLGTIFAIVCRRTPAFLTELAEATEMPEEHTAAAGMLALTLGGLANADMCAEQILARSSAPLRVRLAAIIHVSKTTAELLMVLATYQEALSSSDPIINYVANYIVRTILHGQSAVHQPAQLEAVA
jgi:hypothetical protein